MSVLLNYRFTTNDCILISNSSSHSRCARSDCSARLSSQNSSPVPLAHRSSPNAPAPDTPSESRQLVSPLHAGEGLQEPCDQSHTLTNGSSFKLQWLIKMCISLTILFLLALACALYLCFVLNKSKRDRVIEQRMIAKQAGSLESASTTNESYVVPSTTRSESLSWTATSGSNGDAVDETHLIDVARDDNSYMVKQQHQRLLLANGLIAHEQGQDENLVSRHQQQNCLTLDKNRPIHQPVFGRSAIDQLERMKRRRSIGSSMVLARESSVNKLAGKTLPSVNSVHFDDRQRAKSRSQTTIYYGQSQDPFKAVPFNNNQSSANLNGYLSDGINMVNHQSHQQRSARVVGAPPMAELYSDYNKYNHPTGAGIKSTCQFDPRNSTQQLSDLIKHKHQQHIEQANVTKAFIQSPTTLDRFDTDRIIWK